MSRNTNARARTGNFSNVKFEDERKPQFPDGNDAPVGYTDNNAFQRLTYSPARNGNEDCSIATVSELPCFNYNPDQPHCKGPVTNGFCKECTASILRFTHQVFVDNLNSNHCKAAIRQIFPFGREEFFKEQPIFPLLSLQGELELSDLEPLRTGKCISTNVTHMIDVLHKLSLDSKNPSLDSTDVSTYETRAIAFQTAHTPAIRRISNDLKKATVNMWFTNDYQPKNNLAFKLFTEAQEVPGPNNTSIGRTIQIQVSELKNIVDMYLLRIFPMSTYMANDGRALAIMPNVIVINGWVHYGYGFGTPATIQENPINAKHHIINSREFAQDVGLVVNISTPFLTLSGTYDGGLTNQLYATDRVTPTHLELPSLTDITCSKALTYFRYPYDK